MRRWRWLSLYQHVHRGGVLLEIEGEGLRLTQTRARAVANPPHMQTRTLGNTIPTRTHTTTYTHQQVPNYLTQCIHQTVSLKSSSPQTIQLDFITRTVNNGIVGETTWEKPFNWYVVWDKHGGGVLLEIEGQGLRLRRRVGSPLPLALVCVPQIWHLRAIASYLVWIHIYT